MKGFVKRNARELILVLVIVVLIALFSAVSDSFIAVGTLMNFLRQNVVLLIASLGMLLCMLTGGLDLSVGATGGIAAMCAALAMQAVGGEGFATALVGFVVATAVGCLVGCINGYFIGYVGISPFMTTLATQAMCGGAMLAISGNTRIAVAPKAYLWLGATSIKIPLGGTTARLPVSLLLAAVAIVFVYIILRKTGYGRKIYAVGGNQTAATCSGIRSKKVIFSTYVINSTMMGIASIVWVGRTMAATPVMGDGLEFQVLTAVILGGASLAGGSGTIIGTVLGVIIYATIYTGLSMTSAPQSLIYVIQGVLIIISVYIDITMRTASGRALKKKKKETAAAAAAPVHAENEEIVKMVTADQQSVLQLRNISKSFPGVKALSDVSMDIERGKVHAIMGENGAGKSTLMKILTGVYTKDEGQIMVDGHPINVKNPTEARRLGISIIYQEMAQVPLMTVAENIFLGKELKKKFPLFLDRGTMKAQSRKLLDDFGLTMDVNTLIQDCRVGQQQMVEIAKAISAKSWVVVMDEPTGAISEEDTKRLFNLIAELKKQNVAIVYISHRMAEIYEIADQITILRDGQHILTKDVADISEQELIRAMVGRDVNNVFDREKAEIGEVVLDVQNISREGVFEPISFQVHAGEVLGFSGLIGAGRTEIMRCLFGLDKMDSGTITLNGQQLRIHGVADAVKAGICMVSEDRRRESIVPLMSVKENIALPSLKQMSKNGMLDFKAIDETAQHYVDSLSIKTPTLEQQLGNLSGGNQQKVCLAKWLARDPKVLIFDEPTRGIDVGAKAEIHKLIERLAKSGMAIIMISSELPELLGASDRIIVLYEGIKTGEYVVDETLTQEKLMASASGLTTC
ncbi:MAG: ATP-binding cassette domain-containing protein [Oscillospiraceae bacterium]|nr:ATP-binding cassette domain-containing protein [Oscillospiraceae bacterium]